MNIGISGTISGGDEEVICDLFRQVAVHLVVRETAPEAGVHYHYLCKVDKTRDAWRNLLRRKLGVAVTAVDPDKGANTWQKAKQYLCKEAHTHVVTWAGPEFTPDNIVILHKKSTEYVTEKKRKRAGENRMDVLRDATKGITALREIIRIVVAVYKEEGWLMQEHVMVSQCRTLYARSDYGQGQVEDGIAAKFTYTDLHE